MIKDYWTTTTTFSNYTSDSGYFFYIYVRKISIKDRDAEYQILRKK